MHDANLAVAAECHAAIRRAGYRILKYQRGLCGEIDIVVYIPGWVRCEMVRPDVGPWTKEVIDDRLGIYEPADYSPRMWKSDGPYKNQVWLHIRPQSHGFDDPDPTWASGKSRIGFCGFDIVDKLHPREMWMHGHRVYTTGTTRYYGTVGEIRFPIRQHGTRLIYVLRGLRNGPERGWMLTGKDYGEDVNVLGERMLRWSRIRAPKMCVEYLASLTPGKPSDFKTQKVNWTAKPPE